MSNADNKMNIAQKIGNVAVSQHSRRSIVKAAAWSTPVIAAAVAAPMASASPVFNVTLSTGIYITSWKGDHHYGSFNDPDQASYDFPVTVTDATGNPISGASVTVTASGTNRDGDLLGVYTYPAPSNGGPESSPHATATTTTNTGGEALFAVNTQNLSSSERPATAYLTVAVTYNGVTTTTVVTVYMTQSD